MRPLGNPGRSGREVPELGSGLVGLFGVTFGVGSGSEGDGLVAGVERSGELVAVLAGLAAVMGPAAR